jgi:hypothetical protein
MFPLHVLYAYLFVFLKFTAKWCLAVHHGKLTAVALTQNFRSSALAVSIIDFIVLPALRSLFSQSSTALMTEVAADLGETGTSSSSSSGKVSVRLPSDDFIDLVRTVLSVSTMWPARAVSLSMDLRFDDFLAEMKLSTQDQSLSEVSVEAYFTFR